jgi:hypothetical protein
MRGRNQKFIFGRRKNKEEKEGALKRRKIERTKLNPVEGRTFYNKSLIKKLLKS